MVTWGTRSCFSSPCKREMLLYRVIQFYLGGFLLKTGNIRTALVVILNKKYMPKSLKELRHNVDGLTIEFLSKVYQCVIINRYISGLHNFRRFWDTGNCLICNLRWIYREERILTLHLSRYLLNRWTWRALFMKVELIFRIITYNGGDEKE